MSGIAGIIHFDGKPVEPGLIEKMTSAMAHRGPDGINHWVKGSVALGQCMLRTTPESLEEHQPLTNEDESLVLVMDGRVDNWEELRQGVAGARRVLRNRADAELVLGPMKSGARNARTGSLVSSFSLFGMLGSGACLGRGMLREHGIFTITLATVGLVLPRRSRGYWRLSVLSPG